MSPASACQPLPRYVCTLLLWPGPYSFTGSIAQERLQNILCAGHPHLYHAVISPSMKHSWMHFWDRHQDKFIQFETNGSRRIRWVGHHEWEAGDEYAANQQRMRRNHLRYMISLFLHQNWGEVRTVDDFISAYPHLPGNRGAGGHPKLPLPARGDVVRFVRQNSDLFLFNANTYQIRQTERS